MDTKSAITALTALGQETRLAIYRLLIAAGPEGLPAGEVSSRLGLVQNTVSAHLGVLGDAGLVAAHREGRNVRHAIEPEAMQALIGYLTRECCSGDPSACGFATTPLFMESPQCPNPSTSFSSAPATPPGPSSPKH